MYVYHSILKSNTQFDQVPIDFKYYCQNHDIAIDLEESSLSCLRIA